MTDEPGIIQPSFFEEAKELFSSAEGTVFICVAIATVALIVFIVILLMRRKRKSGVKSAEHPMVANIHGLGRRDSQQDSFAVSSLSDETLCKNKGVLAVLADGMGGMSYGAEISRIVVETMIKGFSSENCASTSRDELMNLLYLANQRVADFLKEHPAGKGGTTLVAALLKGGFMDFVSVGDSKLCLVRDGTITTLNRIHNYESELNELAKKGIHTSEYTELNPMRHALTS